MVLVYVISVIMVEYTISYSEICYVVNRSWLCFIDQTPDSGLIQL